MNRKDKPDVDVKNRIVSGIGIPDCFDRAVSRRNGENLFLYERPRV